VVQQVLVYTEIFIKSPVVNRCSALKTKCLCECVCVHARTFHADV